jgi:DNA helicase-2/ATP-dependent DNA helicase PcrA
VDGDRPQAVLDASRLLAGLDESQLRAVTNPHRPLAILAPAGSGKTRVLARRLAWQSANGLIDPRRALCLSFTREAASELRRRVGQLGLRELPAAGTFHATAYALLRVWWADQRRRPPELLTDRAGYLRQLFPDLAPPLRTALEAELSWAKACGVDPAGYERAARLARRAPAGGLAPAAARLARYEQACRRAGFVDFDDLLARCAEAMETDAGFAATQRWRFRHLFVDEFQDVNPLQFRLLRAWLGDNDDVCVVGDPDQAIYGWNGADADYLARFEAHFPGAATEYLGHNHRSTPEIVAVAAAVLGRAGPVTAGPSAGSAGDVRPEGPVPAVACHDDEEAEGAALAGWCRARFQEGVAWSAQAVLVRTNQLARQLAEQLRHAGVPGRLLLARPRAGQLAALASAARAGARLDDLSGDAAVGEVEDLSAAECALLAELIGEFRALDPAGSAIRFAAWLEGPLSAGRVGGGVTIATFHAAKGLEWRAVHVAGLEDGFVPAAQARTERARAEEQRLLHVALSRATEHLTCSWTRQRAINARRRERAPSPHLEAIDRCCGDLAQRRRPAAPPEQALVRLPLASPADPALGELHAWRRRQARVMAVPEAAVLADEVLREITRRRPSDEAALAAVPGVGPGRAARLGPGLLAALHRADRPAPQNIP